jgi:type I restriction enzyme S subunit
MWVITNKRILLQHHETELQRTALREGDLLVTIKGRIGNAAVVAHLPGNTNINQDVALLRLKKGYHPYYVAAFLNSEAGKVLTDQVCTGQINPFLGLGNLKKVLVPIFGEERMNELGDKVQELVESAYHTEQEAKRLLEEAKRRVGEMVLDD